ncbi:MAG: hypothetical protein IJG50_04235 [Clostridia bacterium]|nr:hypothetical protein [Clostridia bacterium]
MAYFVFFVILIVIVILASSYMRSRRGGASSYDPFCTYGREDEQSGTHDGRTRISAGKYVIDEDIEAGKYDFVLISGEGLLKYRDMGESEYPVLIEFGFSGAKRATRYRNLVCARGGELVLTGSVVLEIQNSKKTVVN